MELILPKYVIDSLIAIENAGFEAWCVGGAVRDLIMGLTPFDYDITTNAEPESIMSIFSKTVPTGIQHGTVTVVTADGSLEVTTYRTEGVYSDHRAPDSVCFVKSIVEDLKRRDFTVNAICYNPKIGIYDPENGLSDINNKVLRCIGNPDERFTEDALRIMRLFRFAAQLGFEIDKDSLRSAVKLSCLLKNISVERIFAELKRTVCSKQPEALNPLLKCGALSFLGLKATELPDILRHFKNDFSLRFAVLCHICNINGVTALRNLKADNQTVENVKTYTELLKLPVPTTKCELKRMLRICTVEQIYRIFDYYSCESIDVISLNNMLSDVLENNEPYLIQHLSVTGNDLIGLGITGPKIGKILNTLSDAVIDRPELNSKEKLLELIQTM